MFIRLLLLTLAAAAAVAYATGTATTTASDAVVYMHTTLVDDMIVVPEGVNALLVNVTLVNTSVRCVAKCGTLEIYGCHFVSPKRLPLVHVSDASALRMVGNTMELELVADHKDWAYANTYGDTNPYLRDFGVYVFGMSFDKLDFRHNRGVRLHGPSEPNEIGQQ